MFAFNLFAMIKQKLSFTLVYEVFENPFTNLTCMLSHNTTAIIECCHSIIYFIFFTANLSLVVVVVCKGIHSRSDTNRTGAEDLSFYYPRLLYCQDQMLAVMLLSQHRVSSSKTVTPRASCGVFFFFFLVPKPFIEVQ